MELRDIEYFAVIAEHGNLRRASEVLDLSPPALSKSLRRLERALQARLVNRSPKGVELTAVGRALAAQVERVRLTLRDVAREAADLARGAAGHLRIGIGPSLADALPPVYERIMREAPRVTLDIEVTDNDVLMPALRRGELDLVLNVAAGLPHEGLVEQRLFDDDYVVCASTRHRLAKLRKVSLEALTQERWVLQPPDVPVRAWLARRFQEAGLAAPHVAVHTRSAALRLQLVAVSGHLAFASRRGIAAASGALGVRELPVRDLVLRRSVSVFSRPDAYVSPAARTMIAAMKALAR